MSKLGLKINAAELLRNEHMWTYKEIAGALSVPTSHVKIWEERDFKTGP